MNCATFHDLLPEILDETLEAAVQAAAREHLRQCDTCRHAFCREQAVAKALGQSLAHATAGLSVRPGLRQNVLRALESKPAPSNSWWRAWPSFIRIRIQPGGAGGLLLGVLLLFVGIQFYRQAVKDADSHSIAEPGHRTCVINIPIQTQRHVFRQQNNTIEDAVASSTSVGHASFFEGNEPPSLKPSSKPL